jgi:hypothetical protein
MKRLGIIALVIFACSCCFPQISYGDFDATAWEFFKELEVPQRVGTEYAFFQIDAEIYDASRGKLDDIRIIAPDTQEVPYQIVTKREREKREEFFPKLLNNSYRKDYYNSFVLDLGEEPPEVNEVTLLTTSTNFMRRVAVEGGNDQSQWSLLVDDAYIYDFSRNMEERYVDIEFPLSNFRFLRIRVFDDGNGPLEITGGTIFRARKESAQTESWPLTIIERTENEDDQTTQMVLDAGSRGLPIRQLTLDVDSRNYHRHVTIASSIDREKWEPLGSGVIFHYDMPEFKKTDNKVSFAENARGRYFRLTIRNYDDAPLKISEVSGSGLVRRVVMPLKQEGPLTVYFGNPDAKTPRYDLTYRIQYLETERLPRLALGPRQPNPDYRAPSAPWTEEHSYLIWVIMAAVIIFLGALIFNLWRKTPPESGNP